MMIQGLLKSSCIYAELIEYSGLHLSALILFEEEMEKGINNYLITENGRHLWNILKIDENLKKKPVIQQCGSKELSILDGCFFLYSPNQNLVKSICRCKRN